MAGNGITTQVSSLPLPVLHKKITRKNRIPRIIELLILSLLFSLLVYRLATLKHHGNEWLIALLCESCFTLIWFLVVSIKWNQVDIKTYPDRLLQCGTELPPVDMFVTTADPILEPPIITVNTVLSLLAVDYPANKLACYISDDGCSPLTYYSLLQASKFARLWVPFCKKYDIQTRAPFRYFTPKSTPNNTEFQQQWTMLKDEYVQLCKKIEHATQDSKSIPWELKGDFAVFSDVDPKNHPTIVKVISDNADGVPHVVYVSREKRPKHPHHFKAGAMNVLTRVSGVMTNAPFMLNVDCDMYANNPQIVLHAMCVLLGDHNDTEFAFAQFPQSFYDGLKDDPFGNQAVVLHKIMGHGIAGIQGSFYEGTGCIHRRKVIYGLSPNEKLNTEKMVDGALEERFGKSRELAKSTAQVISGLNLETNDHKHSLANSIEASEQVAGCAYEYGTSWGREVGWIYGSQTEDILTGLTIHRRGWGSAYCTPDPPAFLGSAPSGGPATLTQTKRWSTGLLEILFSSNSPIFATLKGKLSFRQSLAYVWLQIWALRSIPEICYACLPAYCIITNSHFLPKVNEPAILIPIAIFVIYLSYTLLEYIWTGQTVRAWWNNQRMARINCMTAWLFGLLSVVLKLLGISETVFEVTQKEQNTSGDDDTNANANANANAGRFTFDESPVFVPGTAILLVNLTALVIGLLGLRRGMSEGNGNGSGVGVGVGEFICSVWVLICFWAFLKGLFGTGKYGIPSSTIWKSGAVALLFVYFCKWVSM